MTGLESRFQLNLPKITFRPCPFAPFVEHPITVSQIRTSITSIRRANAYSRRPNPSSRAARRLKPIITVNSTDASEQSKKFEGYISAAFWIGVGHADEEISSVRVRQPVESYDDEVASLTEFADLLVEREINFSVEFFAEPPAPERESVVAEETVMQPGQPRESEAERGTDFESELTRVKEEYQKGLVTKKQFESKRNALLKRWKEGIEGKLGR